MNINYTLLELQRNKEKKEEIWLSPMTKAHTPAEMSKGQSDNTHNATKIRLHNGYGPTEDDQFPNSRNSRVIERAHILKFVNKPYIDNKPIATQVER